MHYYCAAEGGFVDATVHTSADCCPDPARPVAETSIERIDATWCSECGPRSESETDEDICTVELASGGTCGRERPCPYHD